VRKENAIVTTLLRVCVLGIVAVAPLVHAGTLANYVFSGTANGSIGAHTFTDATLNVTGIADIQNIENVSAFSFNEIDFLPRAASLTITGLGSGTFTNLVYIVGNYGTGALLLGGCSLGCSPRAMQTLLL
jgi:hypothetical protein